ncbi:MAG: DegT/DnrJ/EryC1/StrS family aminotransferase, partial [Desulfovibrionaceae bacterium]
MPEDFIPVNVPLLGEAEKRNLAACVDTGWISSEGPFVRELERGMAEVCGRRHGVAVSSGTAALDVLVAALGLGPGDEVVLPAFTIISCVQQIVRAGATPVFADCREDTWCLDAATVAPRITPRTRAVLAVHIYGLSVDMGPLAALCRERGLTLLEDAAQ